MRSLSAGGGRPFGGAEGVGGRSDNECGREGERRNANGKIRGRGTGRSTEEARKR